MLQLGGSATAGAAMLPVAAAGTSGLAAAVGSALADTTDGSGDDHAYGGMPSGHRLMAVAGTRGGHGGMGGRHKTFFS